MNNKKLDMDWFRGIILFLCAGIVPCVVKIAAVPTRESEFGAVRTAQAVADAFSYYKMSILIILGVLLLGYMLMDFGNLKIKQNIKKATFYLPVAFLFLSLLSALFSPYKDVAFNGATERYEGFWIWAVYMLLFACSVGYSVNRNRLAVVVCGLGVGVLLVAGIGAMQYFGNNIYDNQAFAKLVMGEYYNPDGLKMRFSSVFSTLYNPNCVGIYTAMLCPFFSIAALAAPVKKWYKYVFVALTILLFINLFGCESVGGFFGMAAGLCFAALIFVVYSVKKGDKGRIIAPVAAVMVIAVGAAAIFAGNSTIMQKVGIIKSAINNQSEIENPYFFEDVSLDENKADITTKTGKITVVNSEEILLHFTPVNENVAYSIMLEPTAADEGYETAYTCDIPGIIQSRLDVTAAGVLRLTFGDAQNSKTNFYFDISQPEMVALDMFANPVDLEKEYPSVGFDGMERLGSNRGYIWGKSIPLLKENIVIGAGPDCYVFEFPQQDILSKLYYLGNPNIIIDKPHNFYLQVAINTGLISLIVLLALFVLYIVQTAKAIFNHNNDNMLLGWRLGAMAGVIGYLVAVTTTDSVVSVSPVFWILLGTGFALNKLDEE